MHRTGRYYDYGVLGGYANGILRALNQTITITRALVYSNNVYQHRPNNLAGHRLLQFPHAALCVLLL